MATLTVQSLVKAGLNTTYGAAASGGDEFANDGDTFLHVKNGGGGSINLTVASQVSDPNEGTIADDNVVAVPAGEERMIGDFSQKAYNDSAGKCQLTYSGVTSVTIAAIKLVK